MIESKEIQIAGAVFDRSRRYRYRLWREWDAARPRVCFCMLNPSTADARRDDPTIRRCIGFARDLGFGGVEVVNLFAWRATRPGELRSAGDPIGRLNDRAIVSAARACDVTVAAWGVHGALYGRGDQVLGMLSRIADVRVFGFTAGGQPRHPLYLARETALTPLAYAVSA